MPKPTARERPSYRCTECGWQSPRWTGRCGECQTWGTVDAAGAPAAGTRTVALAAGTPARRIGDVSVEEAAARPTGIPELDRVLGGGLVPGAVVLLAGEPGVGKSTLLLEAAAACAREDAPVLYVSGEESAAQVRLRAGRIGALPRDLYLAAETDVGAALGHVDAIGPALLVVDSIQTLASSAVEGTPGGVAQVREVAAALVRVAKERGIATVLVGHVTKDGSVAGPRLLEHLVDVVLQFEGDRQSALRLLRASKNRFGPTDELGCFDLRGDGMVGVGDPSGLFLSQRPDPVPGTCVTVTLEGRRPLLAEVQTLVTASAGGQPGRTTSGIDGNRLAMVLAVLAQRSGGVRTDGGDVYASSVGGVRLQDPAADLALALALWSATADVPLHPRLCAIGEIGLAGEVRRTPQVGRRLAEAARLGFDLALVPPDSGRAPAGMTVLEAPTVRHALAELDGLVAPPPRLLAAVPASPGAGPFSP